MIVEIDVKEDDELFVFVNGELCKMTLDEAKKLSGWGVHFSEEDGCPVLWNGRGAMVYRGEEWGEWRTSNIPEPVRRLAEKLWNERSGS